ncbi:MAG: hypothetical protein Q8880_00685, partial [Bacteroidota bacterium]|nr:hypothetical protein [Bacteroidota bacterium]
KKFNIDKNGKVTWETIGETPNTVYIVEQYRWKRWVEVAKVKSRANKASNYVYYTEIHPHFGVNNIRIREFDNNKEIEVKAETKFKSTSKLIQLLTQKAENELKFSGSTLYEIMDMNLNLILSGYDNKVDVSSLPKGKYYANFDNVSEVFTKK